LERRGSKKTQEDYWLIDSIETFREWETFFLEKGEAYQVAIEIDVGMKRGGYSDVESFSKLVTAVVTSNSEVTFRGLMGYDGYIPFLPFPESMGLLHWAMEVEHGWLNKRYAEFVQALEEQLGPSLPQNPIYNGGGSATYKLYRDVSTPINDLAMGSGV
jgi:hypothetical protein